MKRIEKDLNKVLFNTNIIKANSRINMYVAFKQDSLCKRGKALSTWSYILLKKEELNTDTQIFLNYLHEIQVE